MKNMFREKGFTLIELLIVVAIIAILAAIAVPNFLEAQTRAKVSRAKSDIRTMATAIESYFVDNSRYPSLIAPTATAWNYPGFPSPAPATFVNGESIFNPGSPGVSSRFIWLTSPISYLSSAFRDPFIPGNQKVATTTAQGPKNPNNAYDTYDYVDAATVCASRNGLLGGTRCAGITSGAEWHVVSAGPDQINAFGGGYAGQGTMNDFGMDYDPTNGTVSTGDIVRIGGGPGPIENEIPKFDRVKNEFN